MRNLPRFNVLPTKGNQGLGTQSPSDLLPGQIGFFGAETNTAITTHEEAKAQGFYIALGVDKDEDGVTDDIRKSYRKIYPKEFVAYTQKCYTPFQSKIVLFSDCAIDFDTEYAIKLSLNNPIYKLEEGMGYRIELLTYTTEKQIGSATDPDIERMYNSFVSQIRNNKYLNNFIEIELQDPSTHAVITDLATWVASNPGAAPDIQFTVNKPTIAQPVDELYRFYTPIEIDVDFYFIKGFESNGTTTVTQDLVYESATGRYVQDLERQASGWNGETGPYREYNFGPKKELYLSKKTESYSLVTLDYRFVSEGGYNHHYKNDISVIIAIPDGDTVTSQAVKDTIGTLITGSANGLTPTTC